MHQALRIELPAEYAQLPLKKSCRTQPNSAYWIACVVSLRKIEVNCVAQALQDDTTPLFYSQPAGSSSCNPLSFVVLVC
jgi:hypothetical protein